MKVKVSPLTEETLLKIKQKNIAKARAFAKGHPYTNMVHTALMTKLPYEFIKQNWKEITE